MKRIQTGIFVIFISLLFSGCKNPDSATNELIIEPIIEPVGGSYYYVKNQTDLDLSAQFPVPTYDRTIDKMVDIDSVVTIPHLATTKLFEDLGNFGLNPTPSHTFKNIKFFKMTDGVKTLVFELNPVKNDRWISTILSREEYDYGLTEYQLVLGKEDL
ncbi:hypothetical protein [Dyadobacter frigoris]|uniref:Lipoprotein n=1 Tax=Dyadobacter frigoris TaxID=2576211 RepID=A0A4U6D5Y8_9BACT|nr:hypothetical protein [Dyadobacter frigoris]TKT92789.1 hypothetical protein FDK13_08270 [Dyadobacter frigoris]GLU51690.1 hypothetical protein Dfri01_11510 [Dyadobacter frigoris]